MGEKQQEWLPKVEPAGDKVKVTYPFGVRYIPKIDPRKYLEKKENAGRETSTAAVNR